MGNHDKREVKSIDIFSKKNRGIIFTAGQKVLFAGDSITEAENKANVQIVYNGSRIAGTYTQPFGYGYVNMVRNMIMVRYPALKLCFVNKGIGGDDSSRLIARWDKDVISEQPDWVSILIGIGDISKLFVISNLKIEESLYEYESNLRQMIERAKAAKKETRIILMEPFVIWRNRYSKEIPALPFSISGHSEIWRIGTEIDRYCEVVKKLSIDYDAVLVQTQKAWDTALAATNDIDWTPDSVHPYPNNTPGYALIALAFLRSVGFEW